MEGLCVSRFNIIYLGKTRACLQHWKTWVLGAVGRGDGEVRWQRAVNSLKLSVALPHSKPPQTTSFLLLPAELTYLLLVYSGGEGCITATWPIKNTSRQMCPEGKLLRGRDRAVAVNCCELRHRELPHREAMREENGRFEIAICWAKERRLIGKKFWWVCELGGRRWKMERKIKSTRGRILCCFNVFLVLTG